MKIFFLADPLFLAGRFVLSDRFLFSSAAGMMTYRF